MPIPTTDERQHEKSADRWKLGRQLLDRWRKELTEVAIELKYTKVVDPLLADSASGEPIDGERAVKQFRGQVIYFTDKVVTVRRPSGSILVLENDEVLDVSDGQDHLAL